MFYPLFKCYSLVKIDQKFVCLNKIATEMFWLFFNSEILSCQPTKCLPQYECGEMVIWVKITMLVKNSKSKNGKRL